MDNSLNELISQELQGLTAPQQEKVLGFVQSLKMSGSKGTPGSNLLRFMGAISKEDLQIMTTVIEEECERIDDDAW